MTLSPPSKIILSCLGIALVPLVIGLLMPKGNPFDRLHLTPALPGNPIYAELKDPLDTPIPKLKAKLKEERQPDGSLQLVYSKESCSLDYRKIGKLVDHPTLALADDAPFIIHGLLIQNNGGSLDYQAINPTLSPAAIEELKLSDEAKSLSEKTRTSLVLSLQNAVVTHVSCFDPSGCQWIKWDFMNRGAKIKSYPKGLYLLELPEYAVILGRPIDILFNTHLDPITLHPSRSNLGSFQAYPGLSPTMIHSLPTGSRIETKNSPGETFEIFTFHEASARVTGKERAMNGWAQCYAHWADYESGVSHKGFKCLDELYCYQRNERHWIHLPASLKYPARDDQDLLEWRIQKPLKFQSRAHFLDWVSRIGLIPGAMSTNGIISPHEFPSGTSIRDMLKFYLGQSLDIGQAIYMNGRELKVTRFGMRSYLR